MRNRRLPESLMLKAPTADIYLAGFSQARARMRLAALEHIISSTYDSIALGRTTVCSVLLTIVVKP